jgi:two-component system cell cycle sensor histidine kinase/response regulator CckA
MTSQRISQRVLVVDDQEPVRKVISRQLAEEGYEVVLAGDGVEALDLLATSTTPFSLVITDLKMPGMDGEELGAELSRNRAGPAVLYMSAYPPPEGLEHFIQKPFMPKELAAAARRALAD